MRHEVSPATAVIVIVLVLLIIGGIYWWATERKPGAAGGANEGSIPADVQQEFQRRMGGMTPGGTPVPTPGR
jgi:hypothetical protein